MGKDYGEPLHYDPDFNGPTHNRSCTDVLWLIIFILFLGGWGFVGYYSFTNGDVERLLAPIDSKGRRCGLDADVMNKKYLVFFDITKCLSPEAPITGCPTPQVCVSQCPDTTILFESVLTASSLDQLRARMVCSDDVNTQTMTLQQAQQYMQQEKCAKFVLQSQPVLYRCIGDLSTLKCQDGRGSTLRPAGQAAGAEVCVRDPAAARSTLVHRATALDSYVGLIVASWVTFFTRDERDLQVLSSQIVEDLVQSRWYLAGALVGVVVLCLVYIVLLRWVVAPVVWTSIVGLLALLGFSLYLCYRNYEYYLANPVSLIQTTNLKGYAQSIFASHRTWLALLVALAVLLVVLTLMVIFLRNRITIAIALIGEGSKAVSDIKSTMAFPLFPWLIQCVIIGYGVVVLVYLLSIGQSTFSVVNFANDTCNCNGKYTKDYESCDPVEFTANCHDSASPALPCRQATCHFTGIESPYSVTYMQIVNVVGFFWAMFFISGLSDMMLASTFSTWYWTFHKRDVPFFTLTKGIYRTMRYHMGTVAIGALIITIVRVIRVFLEYVDHKLKKFDNSFTRCVLCCCKCFFWCLENFLKFINKNAYIMCAVHGKGFCKSARDAFSLLMRNIIRVVVLDKVTDFIFFLSKLLISIGVGIGVFYLLQWSYIYEVTQGQRLHYNYVPAIILAVATYLITTIFFNVYAMAVDTLFLCFLEDCERNDGSVEKPYFMSKNLMKILGKKNKKPKAN
ncbi:choline transporter-like 2 isoform X2 [Plutella xylostella]|uniref:choline transporter-like 2 isoform X2 n=1 Tax=Plutella xylostella TaxID=51655 RepID=UPI002032CAB0|nr:choline transporter-like 2 isoform X2 [Plutella xylostella]